MRKVEVYCSGMLELSRNITKEELAQIRKIFGNASIVDGPDNAFELFDHLFCDDDGIDFYGVYTEEVHAFNDWCKEKGISMSVSSCIRCYGFYDRSADTEALIRELTRGGVWPEIARQKKGGKE